MAVRLDTETATIIDCPCCNARIMLPREESVPPVVLTTYIPGEKPLAMPSWSSERLVTLSLVCAVILLGLIVMIVRTT